MTFAIGITVASLRRENIDVRLEFNNRITRFLVSFFSGWLVFFWIHSLFPVVFYILAFTFILLIGSPYGWKFQRIQASHVLGLDAAIVVVFCQILYMLPE